MYGAVPRVRDRRVTGAVEGGKEKRETKKKMKGECISRRRRSEEGRVDAVGALLETLGRASRASGGESKVSLFVLQGWYRGECSLRLGFTPGIPLRLLGR